MKSPASVREVFVWIAFLGLFIAGAAYTVMAGVDWANSKDISYRARHGVPEEIMEARAFFRLGLGTQYLVWSAFMAGLTLLIRPVPATGSLPELKGAALAEEKARKAIAQEGLEDFVPQVPPEEKS